MKLSDVRSTENEKLHVFDEDGVKGTDDVLKKGFRGVEDLHGSYRERKGLF